MAFNNITAAPNNTPVIRNFRASIIYSVFAIFLGLCGVLLKTSLSKWTDEKTATRLPATEDFALSKLKKNQNKPAVKRPKASCAEIIPIAVVFALSGSIDMIEKDQVLSFGFGCWFSALFNSIQHSLELV